PAPAAAARAAAAAAAPARAAAVTAAAGSSAVPPATAAAVGTAPTPSAPVDTARVAPRAAAARLPPASLPPLPCAPAVEIFDRQPVQLGARDGGIGFDARGAHLGLRLLALAVEHVLGRHRSRLEAHLLAGYGPPPQLHPLLRPRRVARPGVAVSLRARSPISPHAPCRASSARLRSASARVRAAASARPPGTYEKTSPADHASSSKRAIDSSAWPKLGCSPD